MIGLLPYMRRTYQEWKGAFRRLVNAKNDFYQEPKNPTQCLTNSFKLIEI